MIQLLAGDCRDVLATLSAESVQCVVTSPPYYGLRDYGTALWDGGDAECQHLQGPLVSGKSKLRLDGRDHIGPYDGEKAVTAGMPFRDTCGKCGARRIDRQIGLENSPEAYLATMVAVFREVRRVLRTDGSVFCNMGDGYRDKQLLLMPARLALALQADGWWVRSDIIWHKPNPMPESCTDRPTSAHEHVFLLTRSARYYYDAEAVREDAEYGRSIATAAWHAKADANSAGVRFKNTTTPGNGGSRNLRNVWTLPTHPYAQAHFATYPPALAERCIRAGTSERGACSQCGKPWVRVVERANATRTRLSGIGVDCDAGTAGRAGEPETTTTGWSPACACNAGDPVPCKVLDPFAGAGTTLLVADRLQRDAIGIELNPDYTTMAMQRCRDDAPLFTAFPPADDPEEARMADLFADAEYAQLSPPKPDAFRNSGRYVNQGLAPSNGQPEAAD
jgi:DNA modification methylase